LENVTEIGKQAFYGCSALAAITFGEGATLATVGTYAFSGCDSLKLVIFHSASAVAGLLDYDAYGFLLTAVETVVLPAAITDIPAYITDVYTCIDTLMLDGAAFTAYSFHSHAEDADTWENGAHGMTCTACGFFRDFAEGESPLYALGDVNGDGVVDIADIVAVINVASGTLLDPADFPGETDLTNDGVVDIADIVAVINIASGE
jgi:hypothetical protein